jgi:hypothetical protein
MKNPSRLSSLLLLAGIAVGFLGATLAGHFASTSSQPDNFRRFHQRISPDAYFYPPYAMLETLALSRWSPGRTLVIIGGNSVLNGVGQPAHEVWSHYLQLFLGERYVVVNLAFRGAQATQGAALVAESLQRRGYPVIYVANTHPASGGERAIGGHYSYFYWQALAQRRLAPHPARDADLRAWLAAQPPAEQVAQAEARLGASLDAMFRSQSLWHEVGYRHVFTVWSPLLGKNFMVPRASLADNEPPAAPLEQRYPGPIDAELAIVRSYTEGMAIPDPETTWVLEPSVRAQLDARIAVSFPPPLRPRTLILLDESSAYYLERLSGDELERNNFVYHAVAERWREHGIACAIVGLDFTPADYIDRIHLSAEGGRKLALLVAREIQDLDAP